MAAVMRPHAAPTIVSRVGSSSDTRVDAVGATKHTLLSLAGVGREDAQAARTCASRDGTREHSVWRAPLQGLLKARGLSGPLLEEAIRVQLPCAFFGVDQLNRVQQASALGTLAREWVCVHALFANGGTNPPRVSHFCVLIPESLTFF
jgi:hypothetical protein